jgi:hypothetical protein
MPAPSARTQGTEAQTHARIHTHVHTHTRTRTRKVGRGAEQAKLIKSRAAARAPGP